MSKIGIRREIDKTGRLCIPKEMRDLLKLEDEVELILTEEGVLIRKPEFILLKSTRVEKSDFS